MMLAETLVRLRIWRRRHPWLSTLVALAPVLAIAARLAGFGGAAGGTGLSSASAAKSVVSYEPTDASLEAHGVPGWFDDAKLGIFIHWGLFSVPAFASTGLSFGDMDNETDKRERWRRWFAHNAYAEWYFNTIRIEGSPAQKYHREKYGEDFEYEEFVPLFNEAVKEWDPDRMAGLFRHINAKYVVLVTKHHDGFLMWPSETQNPNKAGYHSARDIVGELGAAVGRNGMRMGHYYSGGVDWQFRDTLVQGQGDVREACQQDEEYVDYANAHWRELIDRYGTAVLWNDICYPRGTDVNSLLAHFYNERPDGVVNDRFTQYQSDGSTDRVYHSDIVTPEYKTFDRIQEKKWESCRGVGHSFGFNREEGPEQYISVEELVRSFVDIVAKGGNLLLNVGPQANGTIPAIQEERLRGLGRWLDRCGEAIFGTRPVPGRLGERDPQLKDTAACGTELRFTKKDNALYVILMRNPGEATSDADNATSSLSIPSLRLKSDAVVEWLGLPEGEGRCEWEGNDDDLTLTIEIPGNIGDHPAHALKVSPLTSVESQWAHH